MEQLALALWASVCGYQDIKRLRVSNWLILGGFLISFVYLYVKESSLTGATVNMAMTALFIGVCLSLPGYLLGRLGAADVKYLAALGLASDPLTVLYSLAFGCLLCIALFILVKLFKRSVEKSAMNEEVRLRRAPSKKKSFPFIFAMSAGLLAHLIISKII
ncbi:type 4b pilus Flp prepilin peptidase [Pseudomonas aeruginosa]|uniref:type 4b pilus Flp prepilin peptidase n=1 Tax=Pseudomonas TaxID=286 RepID=UPI0002C99B24|nr:MULTISPECIES: type 4b pilus Flp prepilin peptidase [Pseudomonas]MDG0902475.1 type 4b pilus Flp prepilin peptidase [Pseudomonas sp. L01]ALZ11854.1 peptidase [Pseudomonas aeruginosa]AYZ82938.1 type 4b pilus Flp prepilin peptidase [Pseudomonas aeruginosa]EIU1655102.1 type 4b pilus Flp prepilin peptidase [Pseudomonas aeruginosa]EIU3466268.1 type 4b pilus Flp prepilin peptidase [Pseudomonas aeruginosa]